MLYRTVAAGLGLLAALIAGGASAAAQAPDSSPTAKKPPSVSTSAAVPGATRYSLIEIGGKALPARVEKEWRCREDVTAGTLTLSGDGQWLLETVTREVCGDRT